MYPNLKVDKHLQNLSFCLHLRSPSTLVVNKAYISKLTYFIESFENVYSEIKD